MANFKQLHGYRKKFNFLFRKISNIYKSRQNSIINALVTITHLHCYHPMANMFHLYLHLFAVLILFWSKSQIRTLSIDNFVFILDNRVLSKKYHNHNTILHIKKLTIIPLFHYQVNVQISNSHKCFILFLQLVCLNQNLNKAQILQIELTYP